MVNETKKDLNHDMVKGLFGVDLLAENTVEMGCIRLEIVKSRKFYVPEWFHDYITPRDVLDILNETLASKVVTEQAKLFMKVHDDRGNIKDYDQVAELMVATNDYRFVGYISPKKLYHGFKKRIKSMSVENIIECIENICTVTKSLPKQYIYLYLSKVVSAHWYFCSRDMLRDIMANLIDKISYDNLDIVYSTIYKSMIIDMEKSRIPYYKFITDYNGTWFKEPPTDNGIYKYLVSYYYHTKRSIFKSSKPMDDAIGPYLKEYLNKSYVEKVDSPYYQITNTVLMNPNNIKFIDNCYTNEEYHKHLQRCMMIACRDTNIVVEELDKCFKLCDMPVFEDILFRYVEFGSDAAKIIPYINIAASNMNIHKFITAVSVENLTSLAIENPYVYPKANLTLIDVIMQNLHKFTASMVDKIRMAFSNDEKIFSTLSPTERNELYFGKTSDVTTVCSKYPNIIKYLNNISFAYVAMLYKVDPNIIHYVNPTLLSKDVIISHIRANGYTELNNIGYIGLENVLGVHDLVDLVTSGRGMGHVLDFKNIEYRNAVLSMLI